MFSWLSSKLFYTPELPTSTGTTPVVVSTDMEVPKQKIGKISPFHPMHLLHAEMVMRPEPQVRSYRDAIDEEKDIQYESFSIERRIPIRKNNSKAMTHIHKHDIFNGYSKFLSVSNHINTTSGKVTFSETNESYQHITMELPENPKNGDLIGERTFYDDTVTTDKFYYWNGRVVTQSYYKFVTSDEVY